MMALAIAKGIVGLLAVYTALGILFAITFVWIGINRVDPRSQHTGFGFRLIILPGVVALWPLLLRRWRSKQRSV
jgi:hypothetical protein